MLRVRDIMTRDIVSVASEAPLDVAAWRFTFEAVSGAPVRDANGNLVGMLTKTDLIDPTRNTGVGVRVADAMTEGVWAVHPDAPMLEAVQLMLDKGIHRVLVIDGPEHVVGIVTTTDVLRTLVDGRFVEDPRATLAEKRAGDEGAEDEGDEDDEEAADEAADEVAS